MLPCKTWTDRPFERYAGPWTKKDGLKTTKNKCVPCRCDIGPLSLTNSTSFSGYCGSATNGTRTSKLEFSGQLNGLEL
jgi:hypothetical protein